MLSTKKKSNILRDKRRKKKLCTPARVKNSIFLALQQLQNACVCAERIVRVKFTHTHTLTETCVHAKQNGVFKL